MRFTPKQQGIFRTLVDRAWEVHCRLDGLAAPTKAAKETWYRQTLHGEMGVFTTKQLDARRDFADACAGFEAILGDSIY